MRILVLSATGLTLTLGLLFAVVDWIAVVLERRRLEYVFKPATMVVMIAGAAQLAFFVGGGRVAAWFLPALAFSLLGDVFLMLPGERWFPFGLGAFLLAHVCYIIGLNPTLPPARSLWLLIVIGVLDAIVLPHVVRGVRDRGSAELRLPVIIYGVVLSVVLYSGWATWMRPSWSLAGRVLVSVGTTLFFASDLMLAWNRFVRGSKVFHTLVIVTYHLAQLALVITIGLHR